MTDIEPLCTAARSARKSLDLEDPALASRRAVRRLLQAAGLIPGLFAPGKLAPRRAHVPAGPPATRWSRRDWDGTAL